MPRRLIDGKIGEGIGPVAFMRRHINPVKALQTVSRRQLINAEKALVTKICTALKHGGDQYLHSLRTEKSMRAFGCSGSQITSAALRQRHGVEASRYVHGKAYRTTHGCEHSMRWSRAVKAWHGWIELSVKGRERQGRKTARTGERLLQRCGYEGPNPNPSPKSFATETVLKFPLSNTSSLSQFKHRFYLQFAHGVPLI
jgi:hypothetical protein